MTIRGHFDGKVVILGKPAPANWQPNMAAEVVVSAEAVLFERGLALDRQRLAQDCSLTDCLSFVVTSDLRLTDALTQEHHFEQAGFRALLCSEPPSVSGA